MKLHEFAANAAQAECFLKALGNRHRLMILCELSKGECQVGELLQKLDLPQSSLSQHLARLRRDKLVTTRRASQAIFYSLANGKVVRMMDLLDELFCSQGAPEGKSLPALGSREKARCGLRSTGSKGQTR
jgi:ArsR family transcriptional regulator, virulence genes transcriptional regulator